MTSIDVNITAEMRLSVVAAAVFDSDADDPIDVLTGSHWFRESCFDLLDQVTGNPDCEYADVEVEFVVTRPNPLYRGPGVLFGDPPSETVTETGRVTL